MWRRRVQSTMDRAAPCALAMVVIAAVFLVVSLLSGAAEACPDGKQTANPAVTFKIERISPVATVIVSAAPAMTAVTLDQVNLCYNVKCPAGGTACGIGGGCAASFATVNHVFSMFFFSAESARLSPFDQVETASAQPLPNLRPPRITV